MTDMHQPGDGQNHPGFHGQASVPPASDQIESQGYVPEGEVAEQLRLAHTLVAIAIAVAVGCIIAAKAFDMHPLGNTYGGIWVIIILVTGFVGFGTRDNYPSEAEVWKLCNRKLGLALISVACSALVWLIPTLVF